MERGAWLEPGAVVHGNRHGARTRVAAPRASAGERHLTIRRRPRRRRLKRHRTGNAAAHVKLEELHRLPWHRIAVERVVALVESGEKRRKRVLVDRAIGER